MTVSVTVRANGVPACVSEWVIPKRIFFSDPNSNPTHFFTLCLRFITKISVWKMGRWSVGRFVFDLLLRLCAPVECWPKNRSPHFHCFLYRHIRQPTKHICWAVAVANVSKPVCRQWAAAAIFFVAVRSCRSLFVWGPLWIPLKRINRITIKCSCGSLKSNEAVD